MIVCFLNDFFVVRNIYKYLVTQEIYRKYQDCQEKVNKVKMIHTPHDHGLNRPFSFSNIGIPLYNNSALYCNFPSRNRCREWEKENDISLCWHQGDATHIIVPAKPKGGFDIKSTLCKWENDHKADAERKTQRWPPYDSSCHNLMTWKIFCGYTLASDLP